MYDPRNATASWSWYLHQWKVGIFVALRKIVELIHWKSSEGEIEDALRNWRIIYENAEDFDIQEKDDDWLYIDSDWNWRVDSRHQVKAYKDWKNLNDYKDVLNVQKYVMKIPEWKIIPKRRLEVKWFQIYEFKDIAIEGDCIPIVEQVDDTSRFLHSIVKIQWFWLTEVQFKTAKSRGIIIGDPDFLPNPNKIKLYTYPTWDYCDIISSNDNLKDWCNKEIEIIKWSSSINNIYEKLLYLLDEKIRNKHQWWCPAFSFYDLYDAIKNFEPLMTEQYECSKYRHLFSYYWQEFKLHLPSSIPVEKKELLDKYVEEVFCTYKTDSEFLDYIKELHFYEDWLKNKFPAFNSWAYKNVILECIVLSHVLSLDELKTLLNNRKILFSCCSDSELRKISPIYSLIHNIQNGILKENRFNWMNILNEKIDYTITKYTDINVDITTNWQHLPVIKEDDITKSNKTSLISLKTFFGP